MISCSPRPLLLNLRSNHVPLRRTQRNQARCFGPFFLLFLCLCCFLFSWDDLRHCDHLANKNAALPKRYHGHKAWVSVLRREELERHGSRDWNGRAMHTLHYEASLIEVERILASIDLEKRQRRNVGALQVRCARLNCREARCSCKLVDWPRSHTDATKGVPSLRRAPLHPCMIARARTRAPQTFTVTIEWVPVGVPLRDNALHVHCGASYQ